MKTNLNYHSEKLLADRINPINIYLALRDQYQHCCLLESSDYQASNQAKSFIAINSIASFQASQNKVTLNYMGDEQLYQLKSLRDLPKDFEAFKTQLSERINQGQAKSALFGYHSFEAYSYFEDLNIFRESSETPDFHYALYEYILVFDHFNNELEIRYFYPESLSDADKELNIQQLKTQIFSIPKPTFPFSAKGQEESNISDNTFLKNVSEGIQSCKRGDVFQVVLSRCFRQAYQGDEFNLYRAMRSINPSPYLFYFDFGNFRLLGSSPEAALQLEDGKASINPIAGTVKRTGNDEEDSKLAERLAKDPKEQAEHMMLLDLARNDLSKSGNNICIEQQSKLQFFSHVIHLVSTVSAQVDPTTNVSELIANTFPAGTLSGAPKFKAVEIINRLENQARGFYGGSIGVIGLGKEINQAITIRSVLCKDGYLQYQAGAGIVVKSNPQKELEEVKHKLGAVRAAIKMAENL